MVGFPAECVSAGFVAELRQGCALDCHCLRDLRAGTSRSTACLPSEGNLQAFGVDAII